jgi:hypothetical protein
LGFGLLALGRAGQGWAGLGWALGWDLGWDLCIFNFNMTSLVGPFLMFLTP